MHYWKPPYPGLSNAFNCKPTVKITLSTEQHWWKSGVDALRDTVSVKTPWVLLSAIMTFHTDSCFSSVTAAALSHQPAAHLITGERERSVVLFQTLVRHLTVYGGLLTRDLNALKGSYDAFLKIIILCIWCNRMLLTCFNVQKTHNFSNTVHYCRSSMPRLAQTCRFLQSPSFRHAQTALIGQQAQCIVIGRTLQVLIRNVMPLSIIASFSFQNKCKDS